MKKNDAPAKNGVKRSRRKLSKDSALKRKVGELSEEIEQLRAENDHLKRNLVALLHEDIPFDKAMLGRKPSLVQVVAEMARRGD